MPIISAGHVSFQLASAVRLDMEVIEEHFASRRQLVPCSAELARSARARP